VQKHHFGHLLISTELLLTSIPWNGSGQGAKGIETRGVAEFQSGRNLHFSSGFGQNSGQNLQEFE